jgi:hypothetical protein
MLDAGCWMSVPGNIKRKAGGTTPPFLFVAKKFAPFAFSFVIFALNPKSAAGALDLADRYIQVLNRRIECNEIPSVHSKRVKLYPNLCALCVKSFGHLHASTISIPNYQLLIKRAQILL